MTVARLDLTPAGTGPDPRLRSALEAGWKSGLDRGVLAYDPLEVEVFEVPPLRFYCLPGRETRPRIAPPLGESHSLRRPHTACPFDGGEFIKRREVLRARRGNRLYHLTINKFPVMPLHFLAVRPADDPAESLPQRLQGPGEIEDMMLLAERLGPPYHFFFNSNQGADGSRSGSSVNHWHFQIFPDERLVTRRPPEILGREGGVETGRIADWPACHRLRISKDAQALAEEVWKDVQRVDAADRAYNLQLTPWKEGDLLAVLFPRAPVGDEILPGGLTVSGDFGGFELTGGVALSSREVFGWVKAHPGEAKALIFERMARSTREPAG